MTGVRKRIYKFNHEPSVSTHKGETKKDNYFGLFLLIYQMYKFESHKRIIRLDSINCSCANVYKALSFELLIIKWNNCKGRRLAISVTTSVSWYHLVVNVEYISDFPQTWDTGLMFVATHNPFDEAHKIYNHLKWNQNYRYFFGFFMSNKVNFN